MILTVNAAVLLAIIILLRIGRRREARSRADEQLTVVLVLVFGVLIAPTAFGQGVLEATEHLARTLSQVGDR
ncbi:hypothetical protein [Streptomyces sp. TR06-5]|uniref:hypothetical protein n=1 Tax=unclassified Streptomyces TaxID=2593676 RepID=UPI00399F2CDE